MQQTEQRIEKSESSLISSTVDRLSIGRLHHFKIPRREFVPEQFVDSHQRLRQAELAKQVVDLGKRFVEHCLKPFHSSFGILRLLDVGNLPSFHKAESIPNLVVEVASLLTKRVIIKDVVSGRRCKHQAHTHSVGAELLDKHQRVRRVAKRFRHLTSQLVAHDTCEIHIAERHIVLVFVASHNHTCHPEEDDIRTGNEVGCWIIVFYFLIVRIKDSVEQRNRPQPRREPSVEHVLILTQVFNLKLFVACLFLSKAQSLLDCLGNHISALRQEICRDAVSPPQLAGDTPILDIGHPMTVNVLEL